MAWFQHLEGITFSRVELCKACTHPVITGRVRFLWLHLSSFFSSPTVSRFIALTCETQAKQRKCNTSINFEKKKWCWWGKGRKNAMRWRLSRESHSFACSFTNLTWSAHAYRLGLLDQGLHLLRRSVAEGPGGLTRLINSPRCQWLDLIKIYCFLTSQSMWLAVMQEELRFFLSFDTTIVNTYPSCHRMSGQACKYIMSGYDNGRRVACISLPPIFH